MQVSNNSNAAIAGQWAYLPGGNELIAFTAGKPGASSFFFDEPNLLVEYSSNYVANIEEGHWVSSLWMNPVGRMYEVDAVPLDCQNKSGELYCKMNDLDQLYWCDVWGTTSMVLGPSEYDNGSCRKVSLEIVPV